MPRCKPATVFCALIAVALAAPAGAAAATTSFGCGASAALGVAPATASTAQPTVGSAATSACANAGNTSTGPVLGPLAVGRASTFTHVNARFQGRGAGAFGYVSNVTITAGDARVVIASAQAQVVNACSGPSLVASADSQVTGLSVNGKAIANTVSSAKIPIGAQGSYILLNQTATAATQLTRTAVFIHLVGVGDFAIATAVLTHTGSGCGGSKAPSALVDPCPQGSGYDQTTDRCLITLATKTPIPVGAPFQGPGGGQVIALAGAHLDSPCTRGRRGPRYAVLAVKGAGLVTGTSGADRIIAVGGSYEVKGRGGSDCIDVAGGNYVVGDGNGKDRIFAGPGTVHITVGNGNDVIHAGPGLDVITAGNGNDQIFGAPGVDRITVGNGNDTIVGSFGFDRIVAGNGTDRIRGGPGIARITAGTGPDVILSSVGHSVIRARGGAARVACAPTAQVFLRPGAVPFATKHGCKAVTVI